MNKWMIGAGLVGIFSIGSVTFTGETIINNAISYVKEATNNISKYEDNENKLITKLNELKIIKEEMQIDLENLTAELDTKDSDIEDLTKQISQKEERIVELENEISRLRGLLGQTESLYDEIKRLEGQVSQANNKVGELDEALNNSDSGSPLSERELNSHLQDTLNLNWGIDKDLILNGLNMSVTSMKDKLSGIWTMSCSLVNRTDRVIKVDLELDESGNGSKHELEPGDSVGFTIEDIEDSWKFIVIDGFRYDFNIK